MYTIFEGYNRNQEKLTARALSSAGAAETAEAAMATVIRAEANIFVE